MNEKIQKIFSIIKKDGIIKTIKKMVKYINSNYLFRYNIIVYLHTKFNMPKYSKIVEDAILGECSRIIVWRSTFGWNVPLFQRPQHISVNLAKQKCVVFYEVTTMTDKVRTIKKINENLYLINFNNKLIKEMLHEKLKNVDKPKYIQIYSTDCNMSENELKEYIKDDYKIIYEYIDDLSPELVGTKELPKNLIDKYNYMLKDTKNVFVVVTADELKKDVMQKRGKEKLIFACNGVDYNFFKKIDEKYKFMNTFQNIIDKNEPIIGYYGAMASWFDYDLIKYIAKNRPDYQIVLIGIKYDDSFEKSNISEYENIHFLGSIDYSNLKNYANHFDVCMIPFVINDITKATSPLKLFEYMALGKPIVTTKMQECLKYKSVFIGNNKEEFIDIIDKLIKFDKQNNKQYFELLDKEAKENSWEMKAKEIIDSLKKYEKN